MPLCLYRLLIQAQARSNAEVTGNNQKMRTAYTKMECILAQQVREAALDHEAFTMTMNVCTLGTCRATCCHDGVYLSSEERDIITSVVEAHRESLQLYGWNKPSYFSEVKGKIKSTTVPAKTNELADNFPAHFPKTRCIFLDTGHRCVLQRLAMDKGLHPWHWKPVSCWMFPLMLLSGKHGQRPTLTLAQSGPASKGSPEATEFSSCTPCGTRQEAGQPAWQILRHELELLGAIGGRNLIKELAASY